MVHVRALHEDFVMDFQGGQITGSHTNQGALDLVRLRRNDAEAIGIPDGLKKRLSGRMKELFPGV